MAFEADMALNMGQWLSLPLIAAGIVLVIYALRRPRVQLTFPNRFADEASSGKKKK